VRQVGRAAEDTLKAAEQQRKSSRGHPQIKESSRELEQQRTPSN